MKSISNLARAAGFAACLALAACGGGTTLSPSTVATIDSTVAQVQATTASICKFVPTAETILSIVNVGNSALQTASAVARAICAAISKPSVRRGATQPRVLGVPIRGTFVR